MLSRIAFANSIKCDESVVNTAYMRNDMAAELTEEDMRRALFGTKDESFVAAASTQGITLDTTPTSSKPSKPAQKRAILKAFTPRIRVKLRVGNEFEGETYELIHEADTLSSLVAAQDATRKARKKFRFVEVISVESV